MKKCLIAILLLTSAMQICGATTDSLALNKQSHGNIFSGIYRFVKEFSNIDTSYIEPQHYNYTVMMQNTYTYESYRLTTKENPSLTLSPEPSIKIGPYIGWRWIFLGYTLDVNNLSADKNRKELDLSLYSSQIGIDLFWRKTGSGYKIRTAYLGKDIDTSPMKDISFNGFNSSIKGFNIYYIFNHKKFSYPAAFSQSTVQRRSCGSPLLGLGYTKHSVNMDWTKFRDVLANRMGTDIAETYLDSSLVSSNIKYTDISISGGYAYNYVFARNFLLAASVSIALGYKNSVGDMLHDKWSIQDFSLKNFNIDGIGRFGFVWNNTHWYAGTSVIVHSYNYNKEQFSTNSLFGSLNIYVGVNFGRKKH